MTRIVEGSLAFDFEATVEAMKYDDWAFYRSHFMGVADETKAVDLLCLSDGVLWLIEVKDYRRNRRTKPSELADEVAHKVRDTLAGLAAAIRCASVDAERNFATRALDRGVDFKVVLHLEQPSHPSRLFPTVADPADVKMKLKRRLHQAIDDHPRVADVATTGPPRHRWTVTSI